MTTIPVVVKKSNSFLVWDLNVTKGSDIDATINFTIRKKKKNETNNETKNGIDEDDEWIDVRTIAVKCNGEKCK